MPWYDKEAWDKLPKWFRWVVNRLDDPFDNFKHWWHGRIFCIYGRCYVCTAYMKNKPGTRWGIRRIN